ncbi:ankyrin repeat protein [Colletotrichum plurivorum]|uniref:Ankyrin repeat protein n=1 Tax=Colletotrichum plurivorum TaxID=2175906 RepID=A0A8H6N7V2_9PEZI|nr:ankyrin repeat protein [Colletotrichum plurivorum]
MTVNSRQSEALWGKALGGVSLELRELIDGAQSNKRASLEIILYAAEQQRELCIRRQWKIKKRNGDIIILRDVFEKIVQCVNKFKELGKAVAQITPEHAALPWAAIAILLQTGINDTTAFAAMVDGLEVSTSIIARCAIFESVYLPQATSATSHLESSLVSLYGTVLTFLGTCFKYFSTGTARRILRAVRDPAKEIEDAMRHVESRQTEVERTAHIMNMEMLTITSTHVVDLKSMVSSLTLQLEAANARLNGREEDEAAESSIQRKESMSAAITSIMGPKQRMVKASGRKDGLGADGRVVRFDWLSSVRYQSNHQTEAQNRMPGSGQWLFQRPEFLFWTDSSISGTLWLHGPPGCGKTKLASAVIDFDRARAKAQAGLAAPIAYFYCGGGDAERSQPTEVLRCIARQLCGDDPDAPINEDLNHAYEGAGNPQIGQNRLSIEATAALVLKALAQNPGTIVIDALDELRPDDRHELWDCLDNIVRDSPNVVKVFLTSRDDGDIVCRLSLTPNIYISVQDNQSDIERFTEQELDAAIARKRLLRGLVSEQLRWKIFTALNQGFRWVSLQIQNLCDSRRMRLEEDVLQELGQLPQSLSDLYAISFSQISQLSPSSYQVAVSMLQLMLVAIRPISWTEIQHLIQVSHPAVRHGISREQLLDITCNFIADDRQGEGRPRLAHHSVREYLRTRPEFAPGVSNGKAAEMCLHHIREPASPLTKKFCYSTFYLGSHLSATSAEDRLPLRDWLKELLLPFGTSSATMSNRLFAKWRRNLSSFIDAKLLTMRHGIDSAHQCQETMISVTPLAAACAMGLIEIVPQLRPSQNDLFDPVDIPDRDELLTFEGADAMGSYYGKSCVLMAVILDRQDIVSLVHDLGFSVDTPLKTGETALWLAVKRGKPEMVQRLLDYGADPNQTGPNEYFQPKASTKANLRPITGPAADIITDRKRASSVLGFHVRDSSGRLAVQSPFHYEGETYPVLHIAMHTGRGAEIVDQLIRAGADVSARTSRGLTSLEFCLEYSSLGIMFEVFGTLLRAGVSPDLALQNGRTIAHIVAAMGHAELMEMLLEAGANCALRDHFAQSPLDLARRYGHPETAKLLISRGAVAPPVESADESLDESPDESDDDENVLMGPPPPVYRSRSEWGLESSTAQNPSILVQDHDNDSSKVSPTVSNTEPRPQSSPGYAPPTTLEDISEDTAAPRLEVPEVAKVSRRKSFSDSWKKIKSIFGSGTP